MSRLPDFPGRVLLLHGAIWVLCVLGALPATAAAPAETLTEPIYSFAIPPAGPLGELVQTPDGSFYGTTSAGGASGAGTVFSLGEDGALKPVAEFTGYVGAQRGAQPTGRLVLAGNGNYYGVNAQGGTNGFGTIYKVLPNGTTSTVVVFTGAGEKFRGALPYAALVAGGDGYLYGTTSEGGAANLGTVFKLSETDGSLVTLVEFGGKPTGNRGANPFSSLLKGADGLLYGTTAKGGKSNHGTVFSISPAGTFKSLVEFTDTGSKNKGAAPYAALVQSADGTFFGTTARGGAGDCGTIFSMTAEGRLKTLVEFTGRSGRNRGALPEAALIAGPDGNFYGTTFSGGKGNAGTVFKLTPSGTMTALADFAFDGVLGAQPQAGLQPGRDGNFYGTTLRGGVWGTGTVFRVSAAGALTTLVSFPGVDAGAYSQGGIIRGKDSNFYGVTGANGLAGKGSVFRISPSGVSQTLVEFTGNGPSRRGSHPRAPLIQALDGNFYGSTMNGGKDDLGTIFKLTPAGVLTTLVEFSGNGSVNKGATPRAALIQLSNGDFYGLTAAGGAQNAGTVFRMKADGTLTTLVEFSNNGAINKGAYPEAALVLGSDQQLYGTTARGGSKGLGTLFSMTQAGALTTHVEFEDDPAGIVGAIPEAPLIESSGSFYGTTATGGATGDGTVFAFNPGSGLRSLVEFTGQRGRNKGSGPTGALLLGSDGLFYGTTAFGGKAGQGTAFRMDADGALSTIVELAYTDGALPETGFVAGTDGNLYTTTSLGGSSGAGAIFRVRLRTATDAVEAAALTPYSTQLRASMLQGGLAAMVHFEYGIEEYDQSTAHHDLPVGTGHTVVSADLTGLLPNTVYYFRTVSIDSSGTVYGHDETFTTGPAVVEVLSAASGLFQEPATTRLVSFGVPSIADNLEVAVLANLTTAAGPDAAIVAGTPPAILVRKGSAAPLSTPGQTATFLSFKDPVCSATGKVAFGAGIRVDGKSVDGLWTNAGGELVEVARVGAEAADMEGARLTSLTSYVMSATGTVFYSGTLAGPTVNSTNNSALWAFDEAGHHLLLRRGDLLNEVPITSILALSPVPGSMGQGRGYFGRTLTARVTLGDRTQAILQLTPGLEPVVIGPTPFVLSANTPSVFVEGFGVPSLSGGGATAFVATLRNAKPAIVADSPSEDLLIVAQAGAPAPGAAPATFAAFSDPVYNAQWQTAFLATLGGAGVNAKNRSGLWWNSGSGVSLVARAGSDVPALPSAKWDSFLSLALPENAGPVFLAKIAASSSGLGEGASGHSHGASIAAASEHSHSSSGAISVEPVTRLNNLGLFAVDSNRARRLLVRTGDELMVGAEFRTLSLMSVLGTVLGSPGQARSYNATGDLVFRATFTDHTQAILRIHLP